MKIAGLKDHKLRLKVDSTVKALFLSIGIFLAIIMMGTSCDSGGKYNSENISELDTLFLGLKFGMAKQMFFDTCWSLNARGIVQNDGYNMSVRYKLEEDFSYPAFMNFYPKFEKDQLVMMPIKIHFISWAPWNKQLYSDKLLQEFMSKLEGWYGKGFKNITKKGEALTFEKIDGPRTITIKTLDDQHIEVEMSHADYPK